MRIFAADCLYISSYYHTPIRNFNFHIVLSTFAEVNVYITAYIRYRYLNERFPQFEYVAVFNTTSRKFCLRLGQLSYRCFTYAYNASNLRVHETFVPGVILLELPHRLTRGTFYLLVPSSNCYISVGTDYILRLGGSL